MLSLVSQRILCSSVDVSEVGTRQQLKDVPAQTAWQRADPSEVYVLVLLSRDLLRYSTSVIEIKWAVVFLMFTLCFGLNLSQFSYCYNVLIPRKWCKRKQPCFSVLCPTQIRNTAANFKAKEGRKHERKVSSIANTVEETEKRLREKLQFVNVLEVCVELWLSMIHIP